MCKMKIFYPSCFYNIEVEQAFDTFHRCLLIGNQVSHRHDHSSILLLNALQGLRQMKVDSKFN